MIDCYQIIHQFYTPGYPDHDILVTHSEQVAGLAVRLGRRLKACHPELGIDLDFVREAAMLHDVAIYQTNAPGIGCYGREPYIRHGVLGRALLEQMGLPRHALVCERHTGSGISMADIKRQQLPLPEHDMLPQNLEEKLVCYADKFFSKSHIHRMKTMEKAREQLKKYGDDSVRRFDELVALFGLPDEKWDIKTINKI